MTITQLLESLDRAAKERRRRDRALRIPAALLGVSLLALIVFARRLGVDRTWSLLNWWFVAATLLLLYVVFSSGLARRRRGVRCQNCGWTAPDDDDDIDLLRDIVDKLSRYDCPECNTTIAQRPA